MMLLANNLSCGYGAKPVVKNVSFSLSEGERLSILGTNGCGKTTLFRAISGLLPYTGDLTVLGNEVNSLSRHELSRRVALLSQSAPIYFSYTVKETVAMGRYVHASRGFLSRRDEDDTIVRTCLEHTGLWSLRDEQITHLSGGQLQRVFLARTFAQDPAIILLDEPTNHLDLKYQIDLIEDLKQWTTSPNRAAVGVFHDVNLALDFATTIFVMEEGTCRSFCQAEQFDLNLLSKIYGLDIPRYMRTSLERWK